MAEREGFELGCKSPQEPEIPALEVKAKHASTQLGSQSAVRACPLLTRLVEAWPKLTETVKAELLARAECASADLS